MAEKVQCFLFSFGRGELLRDTTLGPPTLWPYCLTQTLIVELGRKRYSGASGGGIFIVTNLVFHCDL